MTEHVEYLDVEDLVALAIDLLGDPPPILDAGLFGSAAARPQTTLLDQDAYPDLWSKAAALLHSIVKHHPLVDGNTRLGWLSTAVFLELNGVDGTGIGNDEVFDFVITVTVGTDDIEHVASALRSLVEGAAGRARAPKRSLADLGAPPKRTPGKRELSTGLAEMRDEERF